MPHREVLTHEDDLFGRVALFNKLITLDQIIECARAISAQIVAGRPRRSLANVLIKKRFLTPASAGAVETTLRRRAGEEKRAAIEAAGAKVLTCQHAFGGVNRAVREKLGTYLTDEIIAYTLRTFGEVMKVCLEIVVMAADAGLVRVGEPCIAIAGTGRGADTAVVLVPANAQQFFDLRVMEVLAKPRLE